MADKNEAPLISIIVPVYNVEPFLPECIDSILAQTMTDYELILVDDGSTDGSGAICDGYAKKDGRVQTVHKENGGQASARNLGIDRAAGTYLSFIDSDDTVTPDFLHQLLSALEEGQADMAICGYLETTEQGVPTEKEVYFPKTVMRQQAVLEALFNDGDPVYGSPFVSPCNKLYKKTLFDGLRYPEGMWYEDYVLIPYIYNKVDKVAVIPTPLYYYRQRAGSTMRSRSPRHSYDMIDAETDRIRFMKENGFTNYRAALFRLWGACYTAATFLLHPLPENRARSKTCRRSLRRALPLLWRQPEYALVEKLRMAGYAFFPRLTWLYLKARYKEGVT